MKVSIVLRNASGDEVPLEWLEGDLTIEIAGENLGDRDVRLVVDHDLNRVEFVGKLALSKVSAGKTGMAVL